MPVRIPPQNIDAEKALLGSIMQKPQAMLDITDLLSKDSFYSEKHGIIYRAMLDLYQNNEPIDAVTLTSKLRGNNKLESVGGATYLSELLGLVPSASNVEHYAKLVQKTFVLRSLIDAADHIGTLGYNEDKDIDEIMGTPIMLKISPAANIPSP